MEWCDSSGHFERGGRRAARDLGGQAMLSGPRSGSAGQQALQCMPLLSFVDLFHFSLSHLEARALPFIIEQD